MFKISTITSKRPIKIILKKKLYSLFLVLRIKYRLTILSTFKAPSIQFIDDNKH